MEDPIQRYRTKSRDRIRPLSNSLRSIDRLQQEVYKTKQTISSAADDCQGGMHQSQNSRGRLSRRKVVANVKVQSRSKSRGYRYCPFDADGYCTSHPDVRMAMMKVGGWKVLHETCHKCCTHRPNRSTTDSLTDDSCQEESNRRQKKQNRKDTHRRSSSRGKHRATHHMDDSTSQRSRSKSIRSRSKSLRRKVQHLTPKRTVCVDGAPFDKSGRCFVHNHVKLASKKLLGGWKIHCQFCPECAKEDDGTEENCSVTSGISGLSLGTFNSGCDDVSVRSTRSYKSIGSQRSWSSKQSRKRMNKNDGSFLPLDEDGYCLHHSDVQLAEIGRKGGWNVLLDFCPGKSRWHIFPVFVKSVCSHSSLLFLSLEECAEETLIIGGPLPRRRRASHYSSRPSVSSSVKSGRSTKSGRSSRSVESVGTHVSKMPYIDGEGKPGHYSGHVNGDGKPTGLGKMKYKNEVWDGVWGEGTKIHGKTTVRKGKARASSSSRYQSKSKQCHSHREKSRHAEQQRKSGSSRSRIRSKCDELESLVRESEKR